MDSTSTNTVRVSILTPVYKHDTRYTRKCLESLKAQTLKNCEFIIIDNGATKEVKELVGDVTRGDERFRIIKLSKNRGYGRAMNAGLTAARGEYIGVVESDDFVEPTMFETLYTIGEKHNVDIVKSLFYIYENERDARVGITFRPSDYDSPKKNVEVPDYCFKMGSFWSAIYRREMIEKHEIRFEEQSQPSGEDVMWTLKTYIFCRNIFITQKILYHYRKDNPSSSIRKKDSKIWNCMNLYSKLFSYLENRQSEMKDIYWNVVCRRHFLNFIWAVRGGEVSRWNWFLLKKVSGQFKCNLKKGYVKLGQVEDVKYKRIAYHPFRTFISGNVDKSESPLKTTHPETNVDDNSLYVASFLLIPIYYRFRSQDYTKEKYLWGLYKKVSREACQKYFFLGFCIARSERSALSVGKTKGAFTYKFNLLGIPLIKKLGSREEKDDRVIDIVHDCQKNIEGLISHIKKLERGEEKRDKVIEVVHDCKKNTEGLISRIKKLESREEKCDKVTEVVHDCKKNIEDLVRGIHAVETKLGDRLSQLGETHYQTMWFPSKVVSLHQKVFPQFKNIHEGEDVVVVGCGPTLHYYDPISDAKHIFLNRAFRCEKIKFDYGFIWDVQGFIRDDDSVAIEEFGNYDCIKFCGVFLHDRVESPFKVNCTRGQLYRFYSSARWKIGLPAIDTVIHGDLSVYPLADFMSISFAALHFALWTQPRRIFLVGLDTVMNGSFDGRQNPYHFKEMLQGYTLFQEFITMHYPATEIISVNPVGLRGMFRDVYTPSYIQAHPDVENAEIITCG